MAGLVEKVEVSTQVGWDQIFSDQEFIDLFSANLLTNYLRTCRWFSAKNQTFDPPTFSEVIPIGKKFYVTIFAIKLDSNETQEYLLPLGVCDDAFLEAQELKTKMFIGKAIIENKELNIVDALYLPEFREHLYLNLKDAQRIRGTTCELFFDKGTVFEPLVDFSSKVLNADQSNSAIIIGNKYFLKLYRKLFPEINPDVEGIKFLTEEAHFQNIPLFAGAIELHKMGNIYTIGLMQTCVDAKEDAWKYFSKLVADYVANGVAVKTNLNAFSTFKLSEIENVEVLNKSVFEDVSLLAKRTAEMHLGFGVETQNKAFVMEDFSKAYTKNLLEFQLNLVNKRVDLLYMCKHKISDYGLDLANRFEQDLPIIRGFFEKVTQQNFSGKRIRIHGDYHLGQVLRVDNDYILLDFEGEPESTIQERKIKHSPLKDVAGMLRSFHYAAYASILLSGEDKIDTNLSEQWYQAIASCFLSTYLEEMKNGEFYIGTIAEISDLIRMHLLEKAIYELGYELNSRPDWVIIPLKGIDMVISSLKNKLTN